MKADIWLRKQWCLLMGISFMLVLLSLTILSKGASAYCDGWQRDICNHSTKPVTVKVYQVRHGGAWINDKQMDTIGPGACGYYTLHTGGSGIGPIHFDDAQAEADLLIGTCTIKAYANCGDGNPRLMYPCLPEVRLNDGNWGVIGIY